MPLGRRLVGLAMVVAVACSGPQVDEVGLPEPPPPTEPATTTSSTTTTVPVPPDVQDLIATTTMTERGRRIFVAASPTVEEAQTFARSCGIELRSEPSDGPRTHTHGCYVTGRIHLRAPDRPEAKELLYVVAAHELLHAVYVSLSQAERNRIDAEVAAAAAGNARVQERLKAYGTTPTLANEMHSILGSEFGDLPAALEAHYGQYFANRAVVVAARQRTLGAKEEEIERLRASIGQLDARITALRQAQAELRAAGDIRGYNANVPVINGLIGRYNDEVDALNEVIDAYNGLLGG